MRQDVLTLRAFYATSLGSSVRRMLGAKISEAWGEARGLDVLGIGYATPFLEPLRTSARRTLAAMPAAQGVEVWPVRGRNLAVLVDEAMTPVPNALFDRVLVVHALEESRDPVAMLREVWRVMAPSGRVIVGVAARHGAWSLSESTPFGHGRPFSRGQLEDLLREADLEPDGWTRALYMPPMAVAVRWSEGFESLGAALWPGFSGVILVEAVKQTYAIKPKGRPAPVRAFAPRGLTPAPAGRDGTPSLASEPACVKVTRRWGER